MDVVLTHGAGVDVPQKTVLACRVTPAPAGQQADGRMEVRACGTLTRDRWAWSDGLAAAGITHGARERTGESGNPGAHIVEGDGTGCLGNAAHVPHGPGRKTDRADARWRAKRMRHGLRQARWILPVEQGERRDLTRYRTKLVQERGREVNRVQGAPVEQVVEV